MFGVDFSSSKGNYIQFRGLNCQYWSFCYEGRCSPFYGDQWSSRDQASLHFISQEGDGKKIKENIIKKKNLLTFSTKRLRFS